MFVQTAHYRPICCVLMPFGEKTPVIHDGRQRECPAHPLLMIRIIGITCHLLSAPIDARRSKHEYHQTASSTGYTQAAVEAAVSKRRILIGMRRHDAYRTISDPHEAGDHHARHPISAGSFPNGKPPEMVKLKSLRNVWRIVQAFSPKAGFYCPLQAACCLLSTASN